MDPMFLCVFPYSQMFLADGYQIYLHDTLFLPKPHVEEKQAKVSMIAMTNTVPDKHTMVFSLQNADPADIAMPSPWWCDGFTSGTKIPF